MKLKRLESFLVLPHLLFLFALVAIGLFLFDAVNSVIFAGVISISIICLLISLFWTNYLFQRELSHFQKDVDALSVSTPLNRIANSSFLEFSDLIVRLNAFFEASSNRLTELQKQNEKFSQIFSNMTEGIIVVDTQERIVSMNDAAHDILALKDMVAHGQSIQEVIRNSDLKDIIVKSLRASKLFETEVSLMSPKEIDLQVHATAMNNKKGEITGALIVLNNITRLKRLEVMRQTFVSNVSHELKTPITLINGVIETLQDGVDDPEQVRKFIRILKTHSDRLYDLIEDLLELSKIEELESRDALSLHNVNLHHIITSVVGQHPDAAAKSMPIVVDCPASLSIQGNESLLTQVFSNLIGNAVKYCPEKTTIKIDASQTGTGIRIVVSDNGPGIPREHLPHIFQRFYRVDRSRNRKIGGTGLGLSIVKHVIGAHRGTISVTSDVNQGTTFSIWLPRHPQEGSKQRV